MLMIRITAERKKKMIGEVKMVQSLYYANNLLIMGIKIQVKSKAKEVIMGKRKNMKRHGIFKKVHCKKSCRFTEQKLKTYQKKTTKVLSICF